MIERVPLLMPGHPSDPTKRSSATGRAPATALSSTCLPSMSIMPPASVSQAIREPAPRRHGGVLDPRSSAVGRDQLGDRGRAGALVAAALLVAVERVYGSVARATWA